MILHPEVASRLFGVELMIDPGKATAILAGIGGRIVEGGFDLSGLATVDHTAFADGRPSGLDRPMAGRLSDRVGAAYDREGMRPFDVVGSVAVIPIEGTLVHKGAYVGMSSGRTSYQGIQAQVVRAADPSIKGVVFEVDTFGGEVAGAFETAGLIADLSRLKPTLAILTDHAASAGYLLASPARQIVMPPSGLAGSIGVIVMHADLSAKMEKEGVRVTILSAGAHKADGHPAAPLADAVKTRTLARLEASRQMFAAAVGVYRGERFSASAALATEAQVYGGDEAVRMGLVDAVGDPMAAFAAFIAAVNKL
ncbi:S49 family peptidase [Xanthobacter sediminis]